MKFESLSKSENEFAQKRIIIKIRDLINYKNLEPGDKLPSERKLAEKFGTSRSNVRDAIQKLEFYGLLESVPQSGTFVANIGPVALNGIIEDILNLKDSDFRSLVETRILLELKTSRFSALRRTDEDLLAMEKVLEDYNIKVKKGGDAVEEDLLFHLAIAKASGNNTINALMLIITPGIIMNFEKYHVSDENTAQSAIKEHQLVYEAIKKQDPDEAEQRMKEHFKELYKYCYNDSVKLS